MSNAEKNALNLCTKSQMRHPNINAIERDLGTSVRFPKKIAACVLRYRVVRPIFERDLFPHHISL